MTEKMFRTYLVSFSVCLILGFGLGLWLARNANVAYIGKVEKEAWSGGYRAGQSDLREQQLVEREVRARVVERIEKEERAKCQGANAIGAD